MVEDLIVAIVKESVDRVIKVDCAYESTTNASLTNSRSCCEIIRHSNTGFYLDFVLFVQLIDEIVFLSFNTTLIQRVERIVQIF